jgi:hypothetical protein
MMMINLNDPYNSYQHWTCTRQITVYQAIKMWKEVIPKKKYWFVDVKMEYCVFQGTVHSRGGNYKFDDCCSN